MLRFPLQNILLASLLALVSLKSLAHQTGKLPPLEALQDNALLYKVIFRPSIDRDILGQPVKELDPVKEELEYGFELSEWDMNVRSNYPRIITQLAANNARKPLDMLGYLHFSFAYYEQELLSNRYKKEDSLAFIVLGFLKQFYFSRAKLGEQKAYAFQLYPQGAKHGYGWHDQGEMLIPLFLSLLTGQPVHIRQDYGFSFLTFNFNQTSNRFEFYISHPDRNSKGFKFQKEPCLIFDHGTGLTLRTPGMDFGDIEREDGNSDGLLCPVLSRPEDKKIIVSDPLPEKTAENFQERVELQTITLTERLESNSNNRKVTLRDGTQLKELARDSEARAILDNPDNSPGKLATLIVNTARVEKDYPRLMKLLLLETLCAAPFVKHHPFLRDVAFDQNGECRERQLLRRLAAFYQPDRLNKLPDYQPSGDELEAYEFLNTAASVTKNSEARTAPEDSEPEPEPQPTENNSEGNEVLVIP